MDFSLPPEIESFRLEVQAFIADHVSDEMISATHDGTIHSPALHAALAEKGWLSGAVPAELGGSLDPLASAVLVEELQLARAPIDAMGTTVVVASMLLEHGNDFLRADVVPTLLDGSALACFGYTEPESGSDVAAARTRATRDGDEWVIDGSKMWTTLAHISHYVILLTRTDADAAKHQGLTFFLVPLATSGIEIRPVPTMGTEISNATFYDGVRIDDRWRVGEVDGGWAVMKTALKYERGIAGGQYPSPPVVSAGIEWATHTRRPDGTRVIDDTAVRGRMMRALIDVEVARSFHYRTAALASEGAMFGVEGSMTKLFVTESYKRHCRELHDMMGAEGLLTFREDEAPDGGIVEENLRHSPVTTIYGGTSEINRNLVAEAHLGLPRSRG